MVNLSILGIAAMGWLGTPYRWGGFDANGMDCSALVIRAIRDIGIHVNNMNSRDIYKWAKGMEGARSCEPSADCLLFYGKNLFTITHVAIALNPDLLIESGGAGKESLKLSREELLAKDARVRIRPINHRTDLVASIQLPTILFQ